MENVLSRVNADPNNPYYLAIKGHLQDAFGARETPLDEVTWLDVCTCLEAVLKSPNAATVTFPSSSALDSFRMEILSEFSFTKVVLKESSVVCIDPADAAYIKTKYI